MHIQSFFRVFIFVLLSIFFLGASAQRRNSHRSVNGKDSTAKGFVDRMQDFAKESAIKSKAEFDADKAIAIQLRIFEEVRLTMQSAKSYMKSGLDTAALKQNLKEIQGDFKVAADGVFINKGTAQTYRNLTATKKIINELIGEARVSKLRLDTRQQVLTGYRFRMDSLLTTPALFNFPKDSLELIDYLRSLVTLAKETGPVDSALKIAERNVQRLLNAYNLEINQLRLNIDEIEHDEQKMAETTLSREFPNLGNTRRIL